MCRKCADTWQRATSSRSSHLPNGFKTTSKRLGRITCVPADYATWLRDGVKSPEDSLIEMVLRSSGHSESFLRISERARQTGLSKLEHIREKHHESFQVRQDTPP